MRIGIDIDGVLADFNKNFIGLVVKITGRDLFPARPFEPPCWSYPEFYGYTAEENKKVWAAIEKSEIFWQTLDAYQDTDETLAQLYGRALKGDYVYFVTSRPGIKSKQQTEWWLMAHTQQPEFVPTVLIASDKAGIADALQLDAYIDDRFENCIAVNAKTHADVYCLNQPWNQAKMPATIKRVTSPLDMLKEL